MNVVLLLMALGQTGTSTAACDVRADSAEPRVWQAASLGLDLLSRGEVKGSIDCFEAVYAARPAVAIYARDLATAYSHAGRNKEALFMIERALTFGDPDPQARELHAMLLVEEGRAAEAQTAARAASSWEGDLIGAAANDETAAQRAGEYSGEPTRRGALASLVLAARAGEQGERTKARNLVQQAESSAKSSKSPIVLNAARNLRDKLGGGAEGFRGGTRIRSMLEFAHNPAYQALGTVVQEDAARLGFLAEGSIQFPIVTARLDASLRVDQEVYLHDRETLADLDITTLSGAVSVEIPIGTGPEAPVFGIGGRYRDTFGNYFQRHYAYGFEGGPWLEFTFIENLRVILAISGVAMDFVDGSPPDDVVSSQNRDFSGQRAVLGFLIRESDFDVRLDAFFHRDNAQGEAFDNRGAGGSARLRLRMESFVVRTDFALSYRRYGPVGDEGIIGSAARRNELRLTSAVGVVVPLSEHFSYVVENAFVFNAAREAQQYTSNVMSTGVEFAW